MGGRERPSVDLLCLKLNNSTLARGTSGYAPGIAARAPTTAASLPSAMQFAPHNTADAHGRRALHAHLVFGR